MSGASVRDPTSSRAWQARRRRWAGRLPVACLRCGRPVQPWDRWELDHATPRALGGDDDDTWPAHAECNAAHGARLGAELQRIGRAFLTGDAALGSLRPSELPPGRPSPIAAEPDEIALDSPDPSSSVWDAAEWLAPFRDVPADSAWPRYMSAPHPAAVGSFGADAVAWLAEQVGIELRYWQALSLVRALEHDDAGELVWLEVDLTTPRQVGKSVDLRSVATWRTHASARFGEPQLVMHTGKDLAVCQEVMRPARAWARSRGGYVVREANGQTEITTPDDSRWLVRGRYSVYGYAASMALVDECWDVASEVVEDGLEPTMLDRRSPQTWLVSTAHRKATSLFPIRRAGAAASLLEPSSALLLEWSVPASTPIDDRAAWRTASPYWSPARERLLEAKLARALAGVSDDPDEDDPAESFRSQFLNVWPARRSISGRDEPLTDEPTWRAAADLSAAVAPGAPLTLAVEDHFGLGAAACAAGLLADGRVLVWGAVFGSRSDALAWAGWLAGEHPGSRLIAGASLSLEPDVRALGLEVTPGNTSTTSSALPSLRTMLAERRLAHDGTSELAGQILALRVTPSRTGGLNVSSRSGRSDLARAAAWAVVAAVATPAPLPFFVH